METLSTRLTLICLRCKGPLQGLSEDLLVCPVDGEEVRRVSGVWRFLSGEALGAARQFLGPYRQLRSDDGWRPSAEDQRLSRGRDPSPHSHLAAEVEKIRAASLELLFSSVLDRLRADSPTRRLRVVDLGAGAGPVAQRLSENDDVAAIDLSGDEVDGLGRIASAPGTGSIVRIESSFDRVPLADGIADVVLFAGSFHYSTDPRRTLREAQRLLQPRGVIVIIDSPVYWLARSGERMLAERARTWRSSYRRELEAAGAIGFISRRQLRRWGRELGLSWRVQRLPLGWRWHLSPFYALARGRREPARFPLLEARPTLEKGPGDEAWQLEAATPRRAGRH